jgi:membrane fusion protein (multidrug efflux system)
MNTNKFSTHRLVVIFFLLAVLTGCSEKKQETQNIQEIPVVQVLQKNVPVFREFVGEVFGEKDIPIRARVDGVLLGIHFEQGYLVKKGQLLYTIDPQQEQSRVNAQKSKVAEAETALAKAKSDLDRYKPLAEKNAVSKSDLDAKQAQYDAAVSSLEAAKANLESVQIEYGYTRIYSPITGIIGKTNAKVGDYVGKDPNPVILNVVSQIDMVRVNFFLTETNYLQIFRRFLDKELKDVGSRSRGEENDNNRTMELILSDGSTYEHKGMVDFIDRSVDPSTGTLLVECLFPNPENILRPGLYAKVKVKMEDKNDALVIPQRCIMELQGQYSVYVVNTENIVEARQVEPGEKFGDYWVIEEGLNPNEKLVIDALQKVRTGMEIIPSLTEFKSQNTSL